MSLGDRCFFPSFRLSISFSTHSSNNLQDSLIPSETENISFLKICSQTVFLLLTLTPGSTSFHPGLLTFNPFGVTNASFHHPIFFVVQVISYSHFPIFPSLLFPFQLWEFQSPPPSSSFPLRPSHPSPPVSPSSGRQLYFNNLPKYQMIILKINHDLPLFLDVTGKDLFGQIVE